MQELAAIAHISYGDSVLVSVRLSWCQSHPDTDRSPGEIETSGFYRMIA